MITGDKLWVPPGDFRIGKCQAAEWEQASCSEGRGWSNTVSGRQPSQNESDAFWVSCPPPSSLIPAFPVDHSNLGDRAAGMCAERGGPQPRLETLAGGREVVSGKLGEGMQMTRLGGGPRGRIHPLAQIKSVLQPLPCNRGRKNKHWEEWQEGEREGPRWPGLQVR